MFKNHVLKLSKKIVSYELTEWSEKVEWNGKGLLCQVSQMSLLWIRIGV